MMTQLFGVLSWHSAVLSGLSFCFCVMLIGLSGRYPRLAGATSNLSAVQASHIRSTPRVAGVAIFAALAVSITFAPEAFVQRYAIFMAATSLIFIPGLLEDLGFGVSPRLRLLAAVFASLAVSLLLEIWLPRSGIALLDPFLSYPLVGIPLTVFLITGVTNGFNLIDGVNGLAAIAAIICSLALALIAQQVGYLAMVKFNLMLTAAILGFALLNYPWGKIFLGDAGAYTIGFVLSWFGVSILARYPDVSPWAILLTVFWPVADTLLAIYRRGLRRSSAVLPDRLHVHQLVMRALEIHVLGRGKRHIANPLTTLVLAPFVMVPPITAVIVWNEPGAALVFVCLYSIVFIACYILAFPVLRCLPRRGGNRHGLLPELED